MVEGNDLKQVKQWPYAWWYYPARLLWRVVWLTIWKLCWKRIYFLRPCLLKLFGARVSYYMQFSGSTWIEMPWLFEAEKYCAFGPKVCIYNLGRVKVGEHTVISQNSHLCAGTHDYTVPNFPLLRPSISIGSITNCTVTGVLTPVALSASTSRPSVMKRVTVCLPVRIETRPWAKSRRHS